MKIPSGALTRSKLRFWAGRSGSDAVMTRSSLCPCGMEMSETDVRTGGLSPVCAPFAAAGLGAVSKKNGSSAPSGKPALADIGRLPHRRSLHPPRRHPIHRGQFRLPPLASENSVWISPPRTVWPGSASAQNSRYPFAGMTVPSGIAELSFIGEVGGQMIPAQIDGGAAGIVEFKPVVELAVGRIRSGRTGCSPAIH